MLGMKIFALKKALSKAFVMEDLESTKKILGRIWNQQRRSLG